MARDARSSSLYRVGLRHGRLDADEAPDFVNVGLVGVDLDDFLAAASASVGDADDDVVMELAAEVHRELQQRLDVGEPGQRLVVRVWKISVESQVPFGNPVRSNSGLIDAPHAPAKPSAAADELIDALDNTLGDVAEAGADEVAIDNVLRHARVSGVPNVSDARKRVRSTAGSGDFSRLDYIGGRSWRERGDGTQEQANRERQEEECWGKPQSKTKW